MSKFQVPSSNGVGCGDDTHRHTDTQTDRYSHEPNTEESYFTSDFFCQCFVLIGLVWK